MWDVIFSDEVIDDELPFVQGRPALRRKLQVLVDILRKDPYAPGFGVKQLQGNLQGCFSRRMNQEHRMVYTVDGKKKAVYVVALISHYGDR